MLKRVMAPRKLSMNPFSIALTILCGNQIKYSISIGASDPGQWIGITYIKLDGIQIREAAVIPLEAITAKNA